MANKGTPAVAKDTEALGALESSVKNAYAEFEKNSDAVSGFKTYLPNAISQYTNPEGNDARAAIGELSAVKAHALYGAAFTDPERKRADTFLPADGDTAATRRSKFNNMLALIDEAKIRQAKARGLGPSGGDTAPSAGAKVVKWGELK